MSVLLSANSLKAFFDANPARYKTAYAHWPLLADGYLPTDALDHQLCTPHLYVANPIQTAPKVAAPFTAEQILAAITTADALKVMGAPMVGKLLDSINAQDRAACQAWTALCEAAGYITAAEQTAVLAVINGTMNDPSWSPNVPSPCDLAANFVDAQGDAPRRLELAQNADGSQMVPNGIAFINHALGR